MGEGEGAGRAAAAPEDEARSKAAASAQSRGAVVRGAMVACVKGARRRALCRLNSVHKSWGGCLSLFCDEADGEKKRETG